MPIVGKSNSGSLPESTKLTTEADTAANMTGMKPATLRKLPYGHEVEMVPQPALSPVVVPWVQQALREVASGAGITYEQLNGDFSGVNFSSIRMAICCRLE